MKQQEWTALRGHRRRQFSRYISFSGDSKEAGGAYPGLVTWCAGTADDLAMIRVMSAQSGLRIDEIISIQLPYSYFYIPASADRPIFVLDGGTNNYIQGLTDENVYLAQVNAWCANVLANRPNAILVVCTVMQSSLITGASDTARLAGNARLKAGASPAQYVIDFAGDARIPATLTDGTHPSQVGNGYMREDAVNILRPVRDRPTNLLMDAPGFMDWGKAGQGIASSGGLIDSWTGTQGRVVSATGANRPPLGVNAGGLACPDFNGAASTFLRITGMAWEEPLSIYVRAKSQAADNSQSMFRLANAADANKAYLYHDSLSGGVAAYWESIPSGRSTHQTTTLDVYHCYGTIADSSEWTLFVDGSRTTTTGEASLGVVDRIQLGSNSFGLYFFEGVIDYWLLYAVKHSQAQSAAILTAMAALP